MSRITFLKLVNDFPAAYTFSWYTSSATSRSPSRAQKSTMSRWFARSSAAPVGFPGLITTNARTHLPSPLALSHCDLSSATSRAQPFSSCR